MVYLIKNETLGFYVEMALGNGSATANGGVTQEKAPVVNGTNMETLPRTGKQVKNSVFIIRLRFFRQHKQANDFSALVRRFE